MIFNVNRIKDESQYSRLVCCVVVVVMLWLFLLPTTNYLLPAAQAIVDPLSFPNNKFGIHIIGASIDEASPAATLVNSSGGDWGYVTILVESKNRDQKAWQKFFDDLRRRHLIPIIRLATEPDGNTWKLPYEGEEQAWADFLDNLIWPVKNRYIVIYNEPNQAAEWAGKVDAKSYAQILSKTIDALKQKNQDFFALNAGFDASSPSKNPLFEDEALFLKQMEEAVPGIFNKLDGWVSHSYPNPGFTGSPEDIGKGTIRTWEWEMNLLKKLGLKKNLPVFITETGWKHAEGITHDKSLPPSDKIAKNFEDAFLNAWNNPQIVAVTPFLLNYQEEPFDHFSFKKLTGEKQNAKILGVQYPQFYPQYTSILNLPKISGRPVQENIAQLTKGTIYPSIVVGQDYSILLTFKNIGQSIWNENAPVKLRAITGSNELGVLPVIVEGNVEPGQEKVLTIHLKVKAAGTHRLALQFFTGNAPFDQKPLEFNIEAKSPVILNVSAGLLWKKNFAGEYLLQIASDILNSTVKIMLNSSGKSDNVEAKKLLPDYTFDFTLYKPFYKPKTIEKKVSSGENILDFGILEPDFFSAILNPRQFWKLLPFSN